MSHREVNSTNTCSTFHWNSSRLIDGLIVFVIFAIYAASPPPDVNEAHYLTKARQFWDPSWLRGDLFLDSGFAHWLFYATFGWLTVVFDLPTSAWIGRIVGWAMLAWGWESLEDAIGLRRFGKAFASICLLALIQIANLSGEWLVGGIEAKVPSYALVFLTLSNVIRERWIWVWPLLGLAIGFHPLVGGWSFLACLFVRVTSASAGRSLGAETGTFFLGVLIAVFLGIWPSLSATSFGILPSLNVETNRVVTLGDEDAFMEGLVTGIRVAAADTYVRKRVNHHLYFWDFTRGGIVGFGLLVLGWRELSRRRQFSKLSPVDSFAAASLVLVGCGIGLSTLANLDWSRFVANDLLRFYWFRLADIAVPTAVALRLAIAAKAAMETNSPKMFRDRLIARVAIALALITAICFCGSNLFHRWKDGRPGADRQSLPTYVDSPVRTWETYRNWVRVCQWINANTSIEAEFLTPRQQQTFKWYAGRVEYVNWKDIPQLSIGIFDWGRRMDEVFGPSWSEFQLPYVPRPEWRIWLSLSSPGTRVRYVVIEQVLWQELVSTGETEPLELVYPSDPAQRTTYVVLKVLSDGRPDMP